MYEKDQRSVAARIIYLLLNGLSFKLERVMMSGVISLEVNRRHSSR